MICVAKCKHRLVDRMSFYINLSNKDIDKIDNMKEDNTRILLEKTNRN